MGLGQPVLSDEYEELRPVLSTDASDYEDGYYHVETDAPIFAAQVVASDVLGRQASLWQGGRLGIEILLADRSEALRVAKALRSSGHRARIA